MWKWKTVCQAAARVALIRLKPSGSMLASIRLTTRWAAIAHAVRSSSPMSSKSSLWRRGMTSAWPLVAGLMSISVTVRSSESTISAGDSPATMAQKMQSGRASGTDFGRLSTRRPAPQVLDRSRPAGDLARVLRGLELGDGLAEHRPRLDSDLRGDLIAAEQRLRQPVPL